MSQYARVRESKAQDQPSDSDTEIDKFDQYVIDAKDRRDHVRAHGNKHLLNLALSANIEGDHVDAALDIAFGALDEGRGAEERKVLTRLAIVIILRGLAPAGFANDFGEHIGKALPSVIANPDHGELAVTMLNALTIASAIEENLLLANADQLLSTWLLETVKVPKHANDVLVAACRTLATICDHEEDEPALSAFLVHALETFQADPGNAAEVLRAIAVAHERFGRTDRLNLNLLKDLEDENDGKGSGGKTAKKELTAAIRLVEAVMKSGEKPQETVTLIKPGTRGAEVEVQITTYANLAVLAAIRTVAGGEAYYNLMLKSSVVHALFDADGRTDEQVHVANYNRNVKEREERYDRLVAAKDRQKGRGAARDRKRDQGLE